MKRNLHGLAVPAVTNGYRKQTLKLLSGFASTRTELTTRHLNPDNPSSDINDLGTPVAELHELRVFRPSNGLGAWSDNLCRDAFPCAVRGSDNLQCADRACDAGRSKPHRLRLIL
jgi:hypothetical protein